MSVRSTSSYVEFGFTNSIVLYVGIVVLAIGIARLALHIIASSTFGSKIGTFTKPLGHVLGHGI